MISTLGAIALLAFASPAMAGEGKFSRADGFQLHIKCTGSGCRVRGKEPNGKWGLVEKGPGGSNNYKKLVAKYNGMGFE
ncbi:hypothetical protein [Thalassococcus lentus]|uniref:Uncharacterized protein n=1 Tax=Thalassococcus lentus TaxID=1210524 RepID=A0ABT4XME4_9RHOB|nr:hypothetical protein [Thalassococcus lentus]MDA7423112.1 hypothetical protein [Thalassococcus lentus]